MILGCCAAFLSSGYHVHKDIPAGIADVVFAVRVLHHAPRPSAALYGRIIRDARISID